MYRNSLTPWLPQSQGLSSDASRGYHHIEGDLSNENAGDDNGPRFSIPRKPVLRTSVTDTYTEDFEMQTQKRNAHKDKVYHSPPFELSFLGCSESGVYPCRDRPLPQWPYNLSINSLVSTYVVILKAAMLVVLAEGLGNLRRSWFKRPRPIADLGTYDDASRGSLGAVNLLWTLRRRSIVSSTGSLVTIGALAIELFAQQIVRYYLCVGVVLGSEATIARTNWYTSNGGFHSGADLESIGGAMQLAINSGIFNLGTFAIPFNCPTGNCTFPGQYHSVGYCSNCTDISAKVNVTQLSTAEFSFTPPSGLSAGCQFVLTMGSANNESVLNQDYQVLMGIANHSSDQFSSKTCPDSHAWACRGNGAATCSLFPCVRTFAGTVSGGNLTETSGPSSAQWGVESVSGDQSSVDMTCLQDTEAVLAQSRLPVRPRNPVAGLQRLREPVQ